MDNQSALTTPLTVGDQIMRTETNILVVTQGQGKREEKEKVEQKKFPQS